MVCNLLKHSQILLGLTASLSGVETSGFSWLCSEFLLPKKGWQDKAGHYFCHSGAQPAVLFPVCLLSLVGYIKIPVLLLE